MFPELFFFSCFDFLGRSYLWLYTRAVQKVKSCIFCLFFFKQHWNKLPRGECSGGLYDHTVKIWRLYVCSSLCFSLVKVELPVAGAAKFEVFVVICFLHAEGQPAIGILLNWSLKIKNEMPLPFEYELGWTAFLAFGTPPKWISGGKRLKNDFQGQPATFSM